MRSVVRIALTILGQPCSKANSRQLVYLGDRMASVKSKVALAYERAALQQIPAPARARLVGPVRVTLRLFYKTELSDMDESLLLDVMQDQWARPRKGAPRVLVQKGVYRNDRQVRERHVFHGIDRANPRAEVLVEPLQAQQVDMLPDFEPKQRALRVLTDAEFVA